MIVIDVRTKGEYEAEHIKGAELFDIMEMMEGKFPLVDADTEIILYCESGNRAMMAQSFMTQQGFSRVVNGGGLSDMIARGYELAEK